MFERFTPSPADDIMKVGQMCRADTRAEKVDLGIGVYKDATGATVVLPRSKRPRRGSCRSRRPRPMSGWRGTRILTMRWQSCFWVPLWSPS